MILYSSPGACALHPAIVANEAGLDVSLLSVDLGTKRVEDGRAFADVTAKAQVPALETSDGTLTEGVVIDQYLAEKAGRDDLLPPASDPMRYAVLEAANEITSGAHVSFGPLFGNEPSDADRQRAMKAVDQIAARLGNREFLVGNTFTIVDAYAFNVLTWLEPCDLDASRWPTLLAYRTRLAQRPSIVAALKAEGIALPEAA